MKHPLPRFIQLYRVRALGEVADILKADGKPAHWDVAAKTMASAWRKFCVQRFHTLLPNPSDYDVSLVRPSDMETLLKTVNA